MSSAPRNGQAAARAGRDANEANYDFELAPPGIRFVCSSGLGEREAHL